MKPCFLCEEKSKIERIHPRVRDREDIAVLKCGACGLVYLNRIDHVQGAVYEGDGMWEVSDFNPGKLESEEREDTQRRVKSIEETVRGKSYLDFGCGIGSVARTLVGIASDVSVVEPNRELQKFLFRDGNIKVYSSLESLDRKFDVISLFHVLEHIEDPRVALKNLAKHLNPGGILHVEVPNADDALIGLYGSEKFKDFTYWSYHLFLFTTKTLQTLVDQAGMKVVRKRQVQRYSLANHLYWLSHGKPGGHDVWKFLREEAVEARYEELLGRQGVCDTIEFQIKA